MMRAAHSGGEAISGSARRRQRGRDAADLQTVSLSQYLS